ncbi:hypothetical protein DVH05_017972 [Phytophthora capsici]|nr:hypothetical protein DVH05_017972 [Phytophthora capsici]
MGRKKTSRYTEDESPNLRPRQSPRAEDVNSDMASQIPPQPPNSNTGQDQASQEPPVQGGSTTSSAQTQMPTAQPSATEHLLGELVKMMGLQQAAIQNSNDQMKAFMNQQAQFQQAMYEQQARSNVQKQKANPPRFHARPDDDLELWLFQIEEHFAAYADLRESNDSRFVDMVVPFLGTDVMSWYREFKTILGDEPRPWSLFKQQIRARFRDSDFEFKLLTKMYELRPTGSQQEYTMKFMQFMSQSSVEMPEVVKRWFYQQHLRPDTSAYVSQSIPETLKDTIEYAQRFEDARESSRQKPSSNASAKPSQRNDNRAPPGRSKPNGSVYSTPPATKPATAPNSTSSIPFVPTCHKCGVLGHKSPDCPSRGTGAGPKN